MTDFLVQATFIAGLIPAVLFFLLYVLRSNWNSSDTGRALFGLAAVTAVSYPLSTAVLMWPEWFAGDTGAWVRIIIRGLIAVALWNLLRVLLNAQRDHGHDKVDQH